MSIAVQPDLQFQDFIETFWGAFGIERAEDVLTQERIPIPQSVQIDAVILFPENFDFRKLENKIFPFLGESGIFEYKSEDDPLFVGHFYQYGFTELGLITTRYLSKERQDGKGRTWHSQRGASKLWERLRAQGAHHSCCAVILSTTDPLHLRKAVGLQPVTDYPHLDGALYRRVMSEDKFVGSIACYLVVLNKLPVCAKNAPLLLLAKGKKQSEFCEWLLEDSEALTLEQKVYYQFYLVQNHLIKNQEVKKQIMHNLSTATNRHWLLQFMDLIQEKPEEEQKEWDQIFLQKMMRTNSPIEVAQKALQADSPVEVALKAIQTEEQRQELLSRLQQNGH